MDSFIFNNFKKRFLMGEVPPEDTWKFTFVNSKFEKYENVSSFKDQNDFITVSGVNAFENACTEIKPVDVKYTALAEVDVNYSTMKPMFINTKNWEEFEKQYHVYIVNTDANGVESARLYNGQDLYTLFFGLDSDGNKKGLFSKFDGFYWVRTKEELAWCADHVNGEINGNKIGSFNNKIAIVLGDDIGIEQMNDAYKASTVKISSCIGKYPDRMFEGLLFGNGFGIKNINLVCNNDTNGIVGYLGPEGMIRNIIISGKNYVTCENKISINHIKNKATDVVAGILCGCNYGSIVDVMAVGSVQFNKFVPAVYCVQNKTDSDGTDTYPDANKFFPSYLCINSPGNIIPYVGYFNEGVFASTTFKTKIEETPTSYSANVTCPKCHGKSVIYACTECSGTGYKITIDESGHFITSDCATCDGIGIISADAKCTACNGTGYESIPTEEDPDIPLTKCTTCNGFGNNYTCITCSGNGFLIDDNQNVISCTACEGTGVLEEYRCDTCNGNGYIFTKVKEDAITGTLYKQWCTINRSNNADNTDTAMIRYTNWSDGNFKAHDLVNANTFGYITYYDYKVVNETENLVGIDPGTDVTNGLVWEEELADGQSGWVRAQGGIAGKTGASINGLGEVDAEFSGHTGISDNNGSRQNIKALLDALTDKEAAEYYKDIDHFRNAYKAAGDITLGLAYNLPAVNDDEISNATKEIVNYGGHGVGLQKYISSTTGGLYASNRHSYLTAIQYLDKAVKMNQAGRCAYYVSPIIGMNKADLYNTYVDETISHSGTFVGFLGGAVGKQCGGILDNVTVNLNAYNYLKRDTFRTSADNSIENKETVMSLESKLDYQFVKTINCKTEFDRTLIKDTNNDIIKHKLISVAPAEEGSSTYTGAVVDEVPAQWPSFTFDQERNSEPIAFPVYEGLNINFHEFNNARMYVAVSEYQDLVSMQNYSAAGLFSIPLDINNLITDDLSDAVTGSHNLNQGVIGMAYAAYNYGDFEISTYTAVDSSSAQNVKPISGSLAYKSMLWRNIGELQAYDEDTLKWLMIHEPASYWGRYADIVKYESLLDILMYAQKPEWTVYDDKDTGKRHFKTTTQAWFTPITVLEAIRCSFVMDKNFESYAKSYINADPTVTEIIDCDSIIDSDGSTLGSGIIYPQTDHDGVSYVDYILRNSYHRVKHSLDAIGNFNRNYLYHEDKILDATRWGKQFLSSQPYMLNLTFKNELGDIQVYPAKINAIAINEIICHEEAVQEGKTTTTIYKQSQMVIDECNGITLQGVSCDETTNKRTEIEIYIEKLDMTDPRSLNFINKVASKVLREFDKDADSATLYSKENITGEGALTYYDMRKAAQFNINEYNDGIYKYLNIVSDATAFKGNTADQVLYYKYFYITSDMIKNYQSTLKSINNIGAIAGSLVVNNKQYICNCNGYLNNYHGTIFERQSFNCLPDFTYNTDTYNGLYKLIRVDDDQLDVIAGGSMANKGYVSQRASTVTTGEVKDSNSEPMFGIRYRNGRNDYMGMYNALEFKGPTNVTAYETSRIYTDSPGIDRLTGAYKYMRYLYVKVYLKTDAGIVEHVISVDYPSAAMNDSAAFSDIYQLKLQDIDTSTTVKELVCTAKSLFNPIRSTAASSYNEFTNTDGKKVKPLLDDDGEYHLYVPNPGSDEAWLKMNDDTVLNFVTVMSDNYGYSINSNNSYTYLVPKYKTSDTDDAVISSNAIYFTVPVCAIDFDENGYIYTTGNLLKMAGVLVVCRDGRYNTVDSIYDINGNEIAMDAHLPIFTNIGDNPIQVKNIGGTFFIREPDVVEGVPLRDPKTGNIIEGDVKWNRITLCRIKSLNLPENTGSTTEEDYAARKTAWTNIFIKLHYADFTKNLDETTYNLYFKGESEFKEYVDNGILEETSTRIEEATYNCTYKCFNEYTDPSRGMTYLDISEIKTIYTEDPDILHPKYANYNLLDRYGALAAICEYHSSNITDIAGSSNDPNAILQQIANRPVVFTNNKFAYREHSGVKGKKYYNMGPMMASKHISRAGSRAVGHKLYGIASPLIAEIKVVPKSVPSVINFTNGAFAGINETGHWRDGEINQYIGMFTLDQGFRGSINDPGGRCINVALDSPCISNLSTQYNADNIFYAMDHRCIAENLFDWSSTFVDPGNNGVYEIGGSKFYPGNGYSYTTSPIQTITVATNGFKDMLQPSFWPSPIQLYEDLNEMKVIDGAVDFDKLQAGCDVYKAQYPLYLSDQVYNTLYIGNKRRNRYAYYGSSLVLVRDDDSNFYGMVNYNHVRDGKYVNDCVYSWDHGNTGIQFFSLPAEEKWGLTKGWAVSHAILPDYTKYDNQFVYTYDLYQTRPAKTFFTKPVKFDALNGTQGYWIQNSVATGAEADYPVSALNAASSVYDEYYTPAGSEVTKYKPVDEGNLHYRGNLLSLGITKSPTQIRKEISLHKYSYTSAISGVDIQGILVQDSKNNNVMYINMNMGDCYGTETWNMNCKASDDTAISGVSGLLVEIGV